MNLLQNRKLFILLIFVWGLLVYLPSLKVHFVNDEIAFIKRSNAETFKDFISLLDKKDFDGAYYRPLGNLVSGITGYLFDYEYQWYRIFNTLLHTLNGIIFFVFIRRLLPDNKPGNLTALFASLIFISFPVNDYAVIWHTDLFDRLVFSFYLLSLLFFLKDRAPGFLSLLFFLLALLTKEMAFSLPVMIVLLQYFITGQRNLRIIFLNTLPYLLLLCIIIIFRIISFDNNIFLAEDAHSLQSSISIIKNYVLMAGIMTFPFFIREMENVLNQYSFLAAAAGLLFTLIFLAYSIRYRRKDLIYIFLLLFIIITFLPASRLLMRWYLYLPSAGAAAFIAYTVLSSKLNIRLSITILSMLLILYTSYLVYRESIWIAVSDNGYTAVQQLNEGYREEIARAKNVYFATIPAKVDDIPLFHLAFDHHLKHFIASEKEYYVISRSILNRFSDIIFYRKKSSIMSLEHRENNYFLLSENHNKISDIYSSNGKITKISIKEEEEPGTIYFTFSQGKFFLMKDKQ